MTVSVLIPAYNAAATLGETLAALAAQTRRADEILVCDDGSADATAAVAEDFPGVRVLRQANAGVSAARNALLAAATGEIVMFCDADDRPHADWIAVLAGRLEETGADVSLAGVCAGADLSERRYVCPCTEESVIDGRTFFRHELVRPKGTYAYLHACAFRRALAERTPALRLQVGLKFQEDEVLMLGLARRANRVAVSPRCLYDYIFRPTSICATCLRGNRNGRGNRRQYYLRDLAKFRVSGRLRFAVKALGHLVRSRGGAT